MFNFGNRTRNGVAIGCGRKPSRGGRKRGYMDLKREKAGEKKRAVK